MAIMWNGSLIPWIDENGDPYSGAKAYFFDAGTTTPQVTYTEASLSIPHDHPVVANSSGMFPAIFQIEQTSFRVRITDAGGVTIWDVDNISVPTTVVPDPPSGDTAAEFLYQTGDIKIAWRTSSPTGYVRLNGRTIGSASSGATERANADCGDLFIFLWEQDANLVVTGGRGATSAGDWAASKTIALPDWRDRTPVGLGGMGNTKSTLIPDSLTTGGNTDDLGETAGTASHVLTAGQLAKHTPTFTGNPLPPHQHQIGAQYIGSGTSSNGGYILPTGTGAVTSAESAGTPTGTISQIGNDEAHPNVQPSIFVPFFIKL